MRVEMESIKDDFLIPTETWNHEPEFIVETKKWGDRIIGRVYTNDDIYRYLDRGTKVRHARMHRKFERKTQPNVMTSGEGAYGEPEYVSRHYNGPGIEARNWSTMIAADHKQKVADKMNSAVNLIIRKIFKRA